jgi:glycosyltransferase involved in cell wall biosynthesis
MSAVFSYPPSTYQQSHPHVSVVIAVCRPHSVYFPEAVRSVLNQTISNLEVVIVEDPSTVCGRQILTGIVDPRIRYVVNTAKSSLVAQRNRCLTEARSDFVAVLDADDIAEPERLERQLEFLNRHPETAAVGSQVQIIDHQGRRLGYRTFPLDDYSIRQSIRRFSPLCQSTVLFRRQVIMAAGAYQYSHNNTVEDYDLWSRLVRSGWGMANLPHPLVRYRIHPRQMKATQFRDTIRGIVAVKRRYWLDEMTTVERIQMWAESALSHLSTQLISSALIRWRWLSQRHSPVLTERKVTGKEGSAELEPNWVATHTASLE